MAKIPLFTLEGKTSKALEVNDAVFGVKINNSLVHQVYVALTANAREPWAHSKNRGEVRGGGKKPWKQKGTGRARHGSIRSPIWVGGGVAFGPLKERNYKQKINKKMGASAVRMCLSDKVNSEMICALEAMPETGKTKDVAAMAKNISAQIPAFSRSTLVVVEKKNVMVSRAMRNMPNVSLVRAVDVNVADLLNHQYVVAEAKAVEALESRLVKADK